MTVHNLSRREWDRRFAVLRDKLGTEAAVMAMHALHGPRDSEFPACGEDAWRIYQARGGIGVCSGALPGLYMAVTPAEARRLASALHKAADWLDRHPGEDSDERVAA